MELLRSNNIMRMLYRPFTANLILALQDLEANTLVLGDQLKGGLAVSLTDLALISNTLRVIREECIMDFTVKENEDGTIKTVPRRKTGFHKTENRAVARQLTELHGGSELPLGVEPNTQLEQSKEEGDNSNAYTVRFPDSPQ